MSVITFNANEDYDDTAFDVDVSGNLKETSSPVLIYLANGNCVSINAFGCMKYWTDTGKKLQLVGQFCDDGLVIN